MTAMGKAESPVVQRTFQKRRCYMQAKRSIYWALLNAVVAICLYLELAYGQTIANIQFRNNIAWYIGCGLLCLFTLNFVVDIFRYIRYWSVGVVELTEAQIKLLGINKNDIGFRLATPQPSSPNQTLNNSGPIVSPSKFCLMTPIGSVSLSPTGSSPTTPRHQYSPGQGGSPSPPSHQSGLLTRQSSATALTPSGSFIGSPPSSHGPSPSGSFLQNSGMLSQSLSQHGSSFSASFNQSFPGSTPTHSPMFRDSLNESSGLRSRFNNNSFKSSPVQADAQIKDLKGLEEYLKEQESKAHIASLDNSSGGSQSFWSFNRSFTDYSPMLRKYTYQIACRSPQSARTRTDENDEGPAQYEAHEVWAKAGVLMDEVELWVEQLRKWLGMTIFSRLHSEITKLNKMLENIGCEDMQIGEVSISTLKQLTITKSQYLPTLTSLIPYLEISTNQDYLVHRILELGSSGCISEFRWQSGGEYKGKPWAQHLPTDSAIVLHALCTYMDNRLPPHPKYPDGKTFTKQYCLQTPEKPNWEKKDNLLIYQTNINPPHFKVVIGDDVWNLPKGRNNLFHAILLFLHHIKTQQHGMLGKVNLGFSGINMLRILDNS